MITVKMGSDGLQPESFGTFEFYNEECTWTCIQSGKFQDIVMKATAEYRKRFDTDYGIILVTTLKNPN